jgi:hypothetical protein
LRNARRVERAFIKALADHRPHRRSSCRAVPLAIASGFGVRMPGLWRWVTTFARKRRS